MSAIPSDTATAADLMNVAQRLINASDAMVDNPAGGPAQAAAMNGAGLFAIAGALLEVAAAIRQTKGTNP